MNISKMGDAVSGSLIPVGDCDTGDMEWVGTLSKMNRKGECFMVAKKSAGEQ